MSEKKIPTKIRAKLRATLAEDFQGEVLHKAGASIEFGCEVKSKTMGTFVLTVPDPVTLFLNKAESFIESANHSRSNIIAKQKYKSLKTEDRYKYIQSSMGVFIFLVAALESFLNIMIPGEYIYVDNKKGKLDKDAIQRELNMYRKIDIVVKHNNSKIKEDSVIWKSITEILDIRNEIVHLKDIKLANQGVIFEKIFDSDFELYIKNLRDFITSVNPKYFH